eukprot:767406-Hanusia_phi.AAC.1
MSTRSPITFLMPAKSDFFVFFSAADLDTATSLPPSSSATCARWSVSMSRSREEEASEETRNRSMFELSSLLETLRGGCGCWNSTQNPRLEGKFVSFNGTFLASIASSPTSLQPKVRSIHACRLAETSSLSSILRCCSTKCSGESAQEGSTRSGMSACSEEKTWGSQKNSGMHSSGVHAYSRSREDGYSCGCHCERTTWRRRLRGSLRAR